MRTVILANKVSSLPRPTFRPGFTAYPAPHDDRAAGNNLSAERLEANSLRVGIAPFREVP